MSIASLAFIVAAIAVVEAFWHIHQQSSFLVRDSGVWGFCICPALTIIAVALAWFACRRCAILKRDSLEREHAEAQILESERKYRLLVENVNDGIVIQQGDRFVFLNQQFQEMLGYSADELRQRGYRDISTPESAALLLDRTQRREQGESIPLRYETSLRRKDGTLLFIEASVRDIEYNGEPCTFSVIRDITRRRVSEETLQRQNRRLEILNAVAQATLGSLTPEEICDRLMETIRPAIALDAFFVSRYDAASDYTCPIRTYDTIDGVLTQVHPTASSISVSPMIQPVIRERKPVLLRRKPEELSEVKTLGFGDLKRRSLSLMYVPFIVQDRVPGLFSVQSYTPNAYTQDDLDLLMAIAHQVGPAVEASVLSQELRQSEETQRRFGERLTTLVRAVNELALEDSAESLFQKAVELGTSVLGFERMSFWLTSDEPSTLTGTFGIGTDGNLIDKRSEVIEIDPDDPILSLLTNSDSSYLGQETPLYEGPHVVGCGTTAASVLRAKEKIVGLAIVDNLLRHEPIEHHDGEILHLFCSAVGSLYLDKDREKQLRETTALLIHNERMNALGELTAGVAHELNQPLNNVKILCQSILRDMEKGRLETTELPQDLRDIVAQINKMANIIDHMRVFTRRAAGVYKQKIQLNDCVNNMFVLLGQQLRTHGIMVQAHLADDLPQISGDPIALEQVATILVVNARQAIEEFRESERWIAIKTFRFSQSEVALSVSDNGGGVPAQLRNRIFEPFYTTKSSGKGTGLGLSIATKILNEHNGRIQLNVDEGEGSTFTVVLPVADYSEENETCET